jgi:toxin HigB-1
MEAEFKDDQLDRLETDANFMAGFSREIVRGFRKAMQAIRAATDERDLYRGGLRMEKLSGDRKHQHSVRLNKQWRLILEIDESGPSRKILVIGIEDYH